MPHLARLLILLSLVPLPARAQSMNRCIDNCWSSCSGQPMGSSAKEACVAQCIQYTCRTSVDVWGAIAYSKPDKAYGSAASTDAREAQQKALDECRKAGGKQCSLHILFCSM